MSKEAVGDFWNILKRHSGSQVELKSTKQVDVERMKPNWQQKVSLIKDSELRNLLSLAV